MKLSNAIKQVLTRHLEAGYIDGRSYSASDWKLVKLWRGDLDEATYYGGIEIKSREFPTAVYEVSGELSEKGELDEEIVVHVGELETFDSTDLQQLDL